MAGWSLSPTAFMDQIENDLARQTPNHCHGDSRGDRSQVSGRYRAFSWSTIVSIGSPVFATVDKADKSGRATASGQTILELKPYSLVFLQNNLAYAERLENGASTGSGSMFRLAFTSVAAAYAS